MLIRMRRPRFARDRITPWASCRNRSRSAALRSPWNTRPFTRGLRAVPWVRAPHQLGRGTRGGAGRSVDASRHQVNRRERRRRGLPALVICFYAGARRGVAPARRHRTWRLDAFDARRTAPRRRPAPSRRESGQPPRPAGSLHRPRPRHRSDRRASAPAAARPDRRCGHRHDGGRLRRTARPARPRSGRHPRTAQHPHPRGRGGHDCQAVPQQGGGSTIYQFDPANASAITTPTFSGTPATCTKARPSRLARSSATWAPPATRRPTPPTCTSPFSSSRRIGVGGKAGPSTHTSSSSADLARTACAL